MALEVTGAGVRFHDVTAGAGSSIEGNVRVGGTLSPGDSPGMLSVIDELTMDATSAYAWELGTVVNDLVAVEGDLKLAESWILQLTDAGATCIASDRLDLFTYTGSGTSGEGSYIIDGSQVAASGRWDWSGATVNYDENNRVYLTGLRVVPEPGTLVLLIVGGLCLVVWRRWGCRRSVA